MARRRSEESDYKRIAKHYAKSERLYIQQEGEGVYITDGFTAIKVNPAVYRLYFQTVSPRYRDLKDGERLAVSPDLEVKEGAQVKNIFEGVRKNTVYRSYNGKMQEGINRGDRNLMAILEAPDSDDLYINYDYFNLFRDIVNGEFMVKTNRPYEAVYAIGSMETEVIMLPIRM